LISVNAPQRMLAQFNVLYIAKSGGGIAGINIYSSGRQSL
jgi:hypothetical protein